METGREGKVERKIERETEEKAKEKTEEIIRKIQAGLFELQDTNIGTFMPD